MFTGTVPNSTRHNGKKRPISPEQVIRLFNTASSSSSVPTSYRSNGTHDRGRRSPASSPPSTTHQVIFGGKYMKFKWKAQIKIISIFFF